MEASDSLTPASSGSISSNTSSSSSSSVSVTVTGNSETEQAPELQIVVLKTAEGHEIYGAEPPQGFLSPPLPPSPGQGTKGVTTAAQDSTKLGLASRDAEEKPTKSSYSFRRDRSADPGSSRSFGGRIENSPSRAASFEIDRNLSKQDILGYDFDDEYKISLEDHIPYHLSRYVLLIFFMLFLCFNGNLITNWPPFRSILAKEGAYSWLCKPDDPIDADENTCAAQRNQIASISSVAQSMVYIGSAFAGGLLDKTGPRNMVMIGSGSTTLGYILLAISSEACQTIYPGFIFLALGVEVMMTGLFDFPFLFPGKTSTVLSLFGVGRSIAYCYPMAMDAMWSPSFDAEKIWFMSAGIAVFWAICAYLLIPRYPYLSPDQFEVLIAMDELAAAQAMEPSRQTSAPAAFVLGGVDEDDEGTFIVTETRAQVIPPDLPTVTHTTVDNAAPIQLTVSPAAFHDEATPLEIVPLTRANLDDLTKADKMDDDGEVIVSQDHPPKSVHSMGRQTAATGVWGEFGYTILSAKYWPWIIYFSLNTLRSNFYGSAANDQLGNAADIFVYTNPLQMFPCLALGMLADYWNIFPCAAICNGCALAALLLIVFKQTPATQYSSVMFWYIAASYSTSQNYVFNAQLFPQRIMSRLVGLTMLCAGLFGFLGAVLYSFGTSSGFPKADGVLCATSGVQIVVLAWLWWQHWPKLKIRKHLKEMQGQQMVAHRVEKLEQRPAPQDFIKKQSLERMPSVAGRLKVDKKVYKALVSERSGAMAELFSPIHQEGSFVRRRSAASRSMLQMDLGPLSPTEGARSPAESPSQSGMLQPEREPSRVPIETSKSQFLAVPGN